MPHEYRDSAESKAAGITYHLALLSEWTARKDSDTYVPGAYEADGFIHCTNGLDLLTEIANMFYREGPDERVVLVLDTGRIESELRYDDAAQTFPHIYGPLNVSAVIGELEVERADDGEFVRMGSGA